MTMARLTSLAGIFRRSSTSGIPVGTWRSSSKASSPLPYRPCRSLALTDVNLLAISVDLSGSNDESQPSDSWLAKVGMLESPQEIRLPLFERTHIRDSDRPDRPGLDIRGEKTRKQVVQSKHKYRNHDRPIFKHSNANQNRMRAIWNQPSDKYASDSGSRNFLSMVGVSCNPIRGNIL